MIITLFLSLALTAGFAFLIDAVPIFPLNVVFYTGYFMGLCIIFGYFKGSAAVRWFTALLAAVLNVGILCFALFAMSISVDAAIAAFRSAPDGIINGINVLADNTKLIVKGIEFTPFWLKVVWYGRAALGFLTPLLVVKVSKGGVAPLGEEPSAGRLPLKSSGAKGSSTTAIEASLEKLADSSDGWQSLYIDREREQYWELTFSDTEYGGGPVRVSTINTDLAQEKYGGSE